MHPSAGCLNPKLMVLLFNELAWRMAFATINEVSLNPLKRSIRCIETNLSVFYIYIQAALLKPVLTDNQNQAHWDVQCQFLRCGWWQLQWLREWMSCVAKCTLHLGSRWKLVKGVKWSRDHYKHIYCQWKCIIQDNHHPKSCARNLLLVHLDSKHHGFLIFLQIFRSFFRGHLIANLGSFERFFRNSAGLVI